MKSAPINRNKRVKVIGRATLSWLLSIAMVFSPLSALAAEESELKESDLRESSATVEARPVTLSEIQLGESRADFAARDFHLSAEHGNLLIQLFEGLIHEQEGMGNHNVYELSFAKFVALLTARASKILSTGGGQTPLDFSLNGPVRGWLMDSGYNPLLADVLEAVVEGKGDPLQMAAERAAVQSGQEVARIMAELKRISYRVPTGFSFTSKYALGSYHGAATKQLTRARAFMLNSQGQPIFFEPGLANLLAHVDRVKVELSQVAASPDHGVMEQIKGHFSSLGALYDSVWSELAGIERSVLDLQGLQDAIRYKLSLDIVDTAREADQLKQVLDAAIELRERYIRLVKPFLSVEGQTSLSRWDLFHRLAKMTPDLDIAHQEVRKYSSHAIDHMDIVLGLDGNRVDALRFDTPWELEFVIARDQAEAMGLKGNWTKIRDFKIVTRETYKTAHWTTKSKVAIKDSKGNTTGYRTVTHHHNSSSTDWRYERVEAPDYEVRVAEKLQDFRQRLKEIRGLPEGSQEAAIDALQAEMLALKTKFAKYAVVPPVRKDESEHKVKRVRNLLNQMRGLIAQSEVLETQMAKDIPQFNRNIPKDPPWTQQVRDQLDQLDRSRWKRAKIVGGVTTGLGIIGGACYFYLSSGGGF